MFAIMNETIKLKAKVRARRNAFGNIRIGCKSCDYLGFDLTGKNCKYCNEEKINT